MKSVIERFVELVEDVGIHRVEKSTDRSIYIVFNVIKFFYFLEEIDFYIDLKEIA